MSIKDIELESQELMTQDRHDEKLRRHQLRHWHPNDPEYIEPDDGHSKYLEPEQEIDVQGVLETAKEGIKHKRAN